MTIIDKRHSKLFTPLRIGDITLKHRVILAPLTRTRCFEHIPTDMVTEYYAQRATDGGLLISEGAHTSVMAGNYVDVPGIFTLEQKRAWVKVTDAVHAKGGYIFCQLWNVGRTAHPSNLGGRQPFSSSATILEGGTSHFTRDRSGSPTVLPKEMTRQDMKDTIEDYVHAAQTAMEAGFDGVEIHSANGYLLNQFLSDNINKRTDDYGGSPENRSRFIWEVVDAVSAAIGASRTGIRFSPFGTFQDVFPSDIIGQFSCTVKGLENKGLAFVHFVRERSKATFDDTEQRAELYAAARARGVPEDQLPEQMTLRPLTRLLKNTAVITCGEFDDQNVWEPLEAGLMDGAVFGRYFISNPDLVERLRNGWPLAQFDSSTFYTKGSEGYTDPPTYAAEKKRSKKL